MNDLRRSNVDGFVSHTWSVSPHISQTLYETLRNKLSSVVAKRKALQNNNQVLQKDMEMKNYDKNITIYEALLSNIDCNRDERGAKEYGSDLLNHNITMVVASKGKQKVFADSSDLDIEKELYTILVDMGIAQLSDLNGTNKMYATFGLSMMVPLETMRCEDRFVTQEKEMRDSNKKNTIKNLHCIQDTFLSISPQDTITLIAEKYSVRMHYAIKKPHNPKYQMTNQTYYDGCKDRQSIPLSISKLNTLRQENDELLQRNQSIIDNQGMKEGVWKKKYSPTDITIAQEQVTRCKNNIASIDRCFEALRKRDHNNNLRQTDEQAFNRMKAAQDKYEKEKQEQVGKAKNTPLQNPMTCGWDNPNNNNTGPGNTGPNDQSDTDSSSSPFPSAPPEEPSASHESDDDVLNNTVDGENEGVITTVTSGETPGEEATIITTLLEQVNNMQHALDTVSATVQSLEEAANQQQPPLAPPPVAPQNQPRTWTEMYGPSVAAGIVGGFVGAACTWAMQEIAPSAPPTTTSSWYGSMFG